MATRALLLEFFKGKQAEELIREELETAWLRGFRAKEVEPFEHELSPHERDRMAADYAERVVGGTTRPERPEVER